MSFGRTDGTSQRTICMPISRDVTVTFHSSFLPLAPLVLLTPSAGHGRLGGYIFKTSMLLCCQCSTESTLWPWNLRLNLKLDGGVRSRHRSTDTQSLRILPASSNPSSSTSHYARHLLQFTPYSLTSSNTSYPEKSNEHDGRMGGCSD